MQPLVSILIPAYNCQQWLPDTLRSALAQTWPNKEIIIVDDGSTDDTLAVARKLATPTVTVITQKNQGAAAARNRAFAASRGDYIQWLDADDLLAPDKIARQMAAIAQGATPRTLFSSAWTRFFYRHERAKFNPTSLWCDLSPKEWLLRKLEDDVYMQTSAWLVSRELTEVAGPWNTQLSGDDDGEYFCRVLRASDHVRFVPESKMYYRRSGSSSLSFIGPADPKLEAHLLSLELHIAHLRAMEDSPRVRAAGVKFLQRYMIYFYPERPDLVSRAEKLAVTLGGHLELPHLRWKYEWLRKLFGWQAGKRAQVFLPQRKAALIRAWDKFMFDREQKHQS